MLTTTMRTSSALKISTSTEQLLTSTSSNTRQLLKTWNLRNRRTINSSRQKKKNVHNKTALKVGSVDKFKTNV